MPESVFFTILVIGFLINLVGIVLSFRLARKQSQHEYSEASKAIVKHQVLLNPTFLTYIFTLVAVAIGSYLFYLIFYA